MISDRNLFVEVADALIYDRRFSARRDCGCGWAGSLRFRVESHSGRAIPRKWMKRSSRLPWTFTVNIRSAFGQSIF
jgi:hypothetical protein